MKNLDKIKTFISESEQGTIFTTPEWLEAVAPGKWDYITNESAGSIKACMPIILNEKLVKNPRNLLLNQLYSDIKLKKQNHLQNNFECKNISNIIAELFYITANALSSQSFYSLSNFYINLAKYLLNF